MLCGRLAAGGWVRRASVKVTARPLRYCGALSKPKRHLLYPPPLLTPLRVLATGKALPSQCVTASDLDVRLGQPTGSTLLHSGVSQRYLAAAHESQSQMGAHALADALQRADLGVGGIDLLMSACGVPEQALPCTASLIAHHAGLAQGTPAFDVNASCLGFLVGLQVAAGLLALGTYRRIALVSSDMASRGADWLDPESSLILGDGAAAVIVERGDGAQGIAAFKLATYPQGRAYCEIRAGGTRCNPGQGISARDHLFRMNGKAVFKLAAQAMPAFLAELMAQVPGGLACIDVVVPHQASHLGMAHIARKLGLPAEKIINIYATYGNQVAASLPTALHEACTTGRTPPGTRALLIGSAAGVSLGGLVLQF